MEVKRACMSMIEPQMPGQRKDTIPRRVSERSEALTRRASSTRSIAELVDTPNLL